MFARMETVARHSGPFSLVSEVTKATERGHRASGLQNIRIKLASVFISCQITRFITLLSLIMLSAGGFTCALANTYGDSGIVKEINEYTPSVVDPGRFMSAWASLNEESTQESVCSAIISSPRS